MVVLALFFSALVMALAAVLTVLRARQAEQVLKVRQRLALEAFMQAPRAQNLPPPQGVMVDLGRWLARVGIPLSPLVALLLLALVLGSGLLIHRQWGLVAAVIWWAIVGTVSVFIPQVRYRQKVNQLVSQIPLFIDQVIRGLVTGRNVEGAIKLAQEDLKAPLRDLIEHAQHNVDLGADLGDALREAANFYDVQELHMLALAIHTSRVYGGSPREMLESIVHLIRQREQMQRELRAMTGETRFSAWVLGALPVLLGGYMVLINPGYIQGMWNDKGGRTILEVALGMQTLGGLLLWRMVKSV